MVVDSKGLLRPTVLRSVEPRREREFRRVDSII